MQIESHINDPLSSMYKQFYTLKKLFAKTAQLVGAEGALNSGKFS